MTMDAPKRYELRRAISAAGFALEEIRDIIRTLPDLPDFQDTLFNLSHLERWAIEADYARSLNINHATPINPGTLPSPQDQTEETQTKTPRL